MICIPRGSNVVPFLVVIVYSSLRRNEVRTKKELHFFSFLVGTFWIRCAVGYLHEAVWNLGRRTSADVGRRQQLGHPLVQTSQNLLHLGFKDLR